jgi:hypothetical protein
MGITHIPTSTFVNVQCRDLFLQDNKIEYIEENAFDKVVLSDDL